MTRLIDADALMVCRRTVQTVREGTLKDEIAVLWDDVKEQPTVDAVPVIRCRDCFWYITNELKQDGTVDKRYKPSFCNLRRKYMPENGYCSEAERREDDTD